MPSPYRILVVAAHAAAIAFLLAPPFAEASPMPMPLVGRSSRAIYDSSRVELSRSLVSRNPQGLEGLGLLEDAIPSTVVRAARDVTATNILSNIGVLNNYYGAANTNSQNLKSLLSQAPSSGNDADFQQQCKDELTSYQSNQQSFQDALAQLGGGTGSDKGLANYDKNNNLETLLKNLVNLNKDTLSSVTNLVYGIPGLGPILGPIVYEIKCILDAVLNATEDLTDELLNDLSPSLESIISDYQNASCQMALTKLGSICVL